MSRYRKVSISTSEEHRTSQLHRRPTAFVTDPAMQMAIAEATQKMSENEKLDEEEHENEEYVLRHNTCKLILDTHPCTKYPQKSGRY